MPLRHPILLLVTMYLMGCSGQKSDPGTPPPPLPPHPTRVNLFNFEEFPAGALPITFRSDQTGSGADPTWLILTDSTSPAGAKVMAQTSTDPADGRFPICIYQGLAVKDVDVSTIFKAVSGKVDQAAGLVARLKDKDNYYLVRANALEKNVRFYKVEAGRRKQIESADVAVPAGQWHTLKLSVRGKHFVVTLNGKVLFETNDSTFAEAGRCGMWTKSDSVTYFDQFRIDSYDEAPAKK